MELTTAQITLTIMGMVLGPTGAAWVSVKASLNGTKKDIKEIKETLNKHVEHDYADRLNIENRLTKLEF